MISFIMILFLLLVLATILLSSVAVFYTFFKKSQFVQTKPCVRAKLIRVEKDAELISKFRLNLDPRSKKAKAILHMINDKAYKVNCYNVEQDKNLVVIMIVVGHNDKKMEYFGKLYHAPRGFPIIMNIETGHLDLKGFLPKFKNDEEDEIKTIGEDYDKAILTVKASGYLGQMIAFLSSDENTVYYVGFSKNSGSDTKFVDQINIFIDDVVKRHPGLPEHLVNHKMHLCFEVLAKWDPHGAYVAREGLVGTAAMYSQEIDDIDSETDKPTRLSKRVPIDEANKLFKAIGVYVLGYWVAQTSEAVQKAFDVISANRLTSSYSRIKRYLNNVRGVKFVPGNCEHSRLYLHACIPACSF